MPLAPRTAKGKLKRGTREYRYQRLKRGLQAYPDLIVPRLALRHINADYKDLSQNAKWLPAFRDVYRDAVKKAKVSVSKKRGIRVWN
jgi:hypothetical protein